MLRPELKELDALVDVLVEALVREIEGESKLEVETRARDSEVRTYSRAASSSSAEVACGAP